MQLTDDEYAAKKQEILDRCSQLGGARTGSGAVTHRSYRCDVPAPGVCPYCGQPFDHGEKPTRDHVFGHAFGGQATVPACWTCNNTFGRQVEDRLLQPAAFLNFARATKGLGGARPKVDIEGGRRGRLDLASMRLIEPVIVESDLSYSLRGTVAEVVEAASRLVDAGRISQADLDTALAAATPAEPVMASFTVTLDVKLAARLTAKVAVGAGSLAYGERFRSSALGDELRAMMWSAQPPERGMWREAFGSLDELLAHVNASPLRVDATARVCIFVPYGTETAVFVQIAGVLPTLAGVMVPARLPLGGGLPVIIEDGPNLVEREVASDVLAFANAQRDSSP